MSLTSLMLAARNGDLRGVRASLEEMGERDEWGLTALMWAAINGNLECVELLLSETGMRDNDGETALMKAARWGQINCIPLLEREMGMRDTWGRTALMWAAYNGRTDCAHFLLSEAGKQTTREWDDFPSETTALMIAAHKSHPEVVELLLPYEQGLTDSEGHTAEWYANSGESWRGDSSQVCELLEDEGSDRLPPPKEELLLMMSAATGDVEGVRRHLDHAGYRDPTGTTALMLAAKNGHSKCIPLLEREYGIQDNNGKTALMYAAREGHSECIPLLEKEIGMQDNDGRTALLISLQEGHVECARLLADEAAVREENGQLHIERIRRLVREEGADSPLAKTYRAVENDLEAAVMRQVQMRLEMLVPHHIAPILPPIDQLFEGEDAQELGEAVWSALFGEPGAFEELDNILYEIEDKMADACVVCLSRPKDAVLLPCRHLVICEECADRIEHRCPYCQTDVDEALVIECPEGLDL